MPIALSNARVLVDEGFVDDRVVLVDGRHIVDIVPASDARLAAATALDLRGHTLVPGFIDCQVNGGGGALFNDAPSVDTIRRIGQAHRRYGTTGFLPTLISDERAVMSTAIAAVDDAINAGVPGVLGIHLEGPYLAPLRRGAHDAAKFLQPQADDVALAASLAQGCTLLTLAPEQVSEQALRALIARGVIIAIGHSAASYAQARRAFDLGVRGVTHLFNAMTPLGSREPGVVGAALDDADSWCGLIADGHHVHPATLRVAIAAKACGKMFLVTDAMPPVGTDADSFQLAGQRVHVRNGQCVNEDGSLAGSALNMISAVRNTVEQIGLPLVDALRMAATWPAEFLGLGASRGRIAPGYTADFVVMDDDYAIHETWIAGERLVHVDTMQI